MNENSVILISLFWFFFDRVLQLVLWMHHYIYWIFAAISALFLLFGDTNTKGVYRIYSSCGTYGKAPQVFSFWLIKSKRMSFHQSIS
ncbi:hypothetical protein QT349_26195 (plasmid) [Escherichia coli]|nr:hypothetical protein [Escherichia coli]